ncbi:TPA: ribose 5-phosphate isomerase B [Streptococcus suis]
MKVGIGCDHNAFHLKEQVKQHLESQGHTVEDVGCYSIDAIDYPGVALKVTDYILSDRVERGILLCGTGIGMAMAANKVKGIRAAQVHDVYSAQRACLSNNAHIITIGSHIVGLNLAKMLVDEFLAQQFVPTGSARKIEQLMDIERS